MWNAPVWSCGLLVAAAGVCGTIGADAAASADATCVWPAGAKLILSNDAAQVTVERRGSDGLLDGGTESSVWRGCSTQRGEQIVLASGQSTFDTGSGATRFRLAGSVVGFLAGEWSKYESARRIEIVDLATGARWSSTTIPTLNGSGEAFTELAVNRAGDGAWVRTHVDQRGRTRWLLFVRRGTEVQLRYSAPHKLSHLHLSASQVRWRENTVLRRRGL